MRVNETNSKGFTLIELLIVVAIIAVLAAIAIPQFGAYRARAVRSTMLADAKNIAVSIDIVASECNSFAPINNFSFLGPGTAPLIASMATCTANPGGTSPMTSVSKGNTVSLLATDASWTMTVSNWGANDTNYTGPLTRTSGGVCKWANNLDC